MKISAIVNDGKAQKSSIHYRAFRVAETDVIGFQLILVFFFLFNLISFPIGFLFFQFLISETICRWQRITRREFVTASITTKWTCIPATRAPSVRMATNRFVESSYEFGWPRASWTQGAPGYTIRIRTVTLGGIVCCSACSPENKRRITRRKPFGRIMIFRRIECISTFYRYVNPKIVLYNHAENTPRSIAKKRKRKNNNNNSKNDRK